MTKDSNFRTGRVHLVSGPSSSGKSTLIAKSLHEYDSVLFPRIFPKELSPMGHYALHYNLIRPLWHRFEVPWPARIWRIVRRVLAGNQVIFDNPYAQDPILKALLSSDLMLYATILVVPRSLLLERVAQRTVLETIGGESSRFYPKNRWLQTYQTIDLGDFYRNWIAFLETNSIAYRIVDSSDDRFEAISSEELWRILERGNSNGAAA